MTSTSPRREGAPGRVRIAPRSVTSAVSSTKQPSGWRGSAGRTVSDEPAGCERLAVALVLYERELRVRRAFARLGQSLRKVLAGQPQQCVSTSWVTIEVHDPVMSRTGF